MNEISLEERNTSLVKLQDDVFLLENMYIIRKKIILKLHQFDVVIFIFFNILNWRVLSERQDEKLQPELKLDFSLSQLPIRTILPPNSAPLYEHPQEEVGPFRPLK